MTSTLERIRLLPQEKQPLETCCDHDSTLHADSALEYLIGTRFALPSKYKWHGGDSPYPTGDEQLGLQEHDGNNTTTPKLMPSAHPNPVAPLSTPLLYSANFVPPRRDQ